MKRAYFVPFVMMAFGSMALLPVASMAQSAAPQAAVAKMPNKAEIKASDAKQTPEQQEAEYKKSMAEFAAKRKVADPAKAVDEFGEVLKRQWSYYRANGVDFPAELAKLKQRVVKEHLDLDTTERELQRILMLGIDGHAKVTSVGYPDGRLPIFLGPSGKRFAVIKADYSSLLDPEYPYLDSIDGKDVATWMKLAARYVAKGSPQVVESRGSRFITKNFRYLQQEGGFSIKNQVDVVLASADGARKKTVKLDVDTTEPSHDKPKIQQSLGPSRWLGDGKIGYLRIAKMDSDAVEEIETWMGKFKDAKGLIIDVRNNGGGSREALMEMYSYLADPKDPPRVINAAVYRLYSAFPDDHLSRRYMYRENDPHWTPAEKAAIAKFKTTFKPLWAPPVGEFSDWHYLALKVETLPGVYHFTKPVIVLSNDRIFSAADIFMAGMHSLPNVTILGVPSGGGSARLVAEEIENGAITVKLGSMISYQVDGHLFDGVGVPVNVRVDPDPEFYLAYGKAKDNQLDAALHLIEEKASK